MNSPQMDFVTSDTHFGHANIIKHDGRPYGSADEMDADLIDRWNSKVKDRKRHVWHLGDFAYRQPALNRMVHRAPLWSDSSCLWKSRR